MPSDTSPFLLSQPGTSPPSLTAATERGDETRTNSTRGARTQMSRPSLSLNGGNNHHQNNSSNINSNNNNAKMLRSSRSARRSTSLGVASSSSSSSSSSSCSSRSRCLGFISPRTATLILALLGFAGHLQTFRYLEVLHDSFPNVPKTRTSNLGAPSASGTRGDAGGFALQHPSHPGALSPLAPSRVVLDSEQADAPLAAAVAQDGTEGAIKQDDPKQIVSDKVAEVLSGSSSRFDKITGAGRGRSASTEGTSKRPSGTNSSSIASSSSSSSSSTSASRPETGDDLLAMVKPTRWFNLLPKRPWGEEKPTPEEAAVWRAQQADQDEERKSWEAARTLTKIMRVYALLSVVACLIGAYGVVKSNLISTRIFVMSSFLDVFLFALSLVSMCIIVTYPEVRAMLCEQISSGEIHSLLAFMRGATPNTTASISPSPPPAASPSPSALPAASMLSRAAGSLWKRALSSSDDVSNPPIFWWDTLIDNILENENCDDIFASLLVPFGLLFCLIYLALRIHFLFVIRGFYVTLLRDRLAYYLRSPTSPWTAGSGLLGMSSGSEKERKYSSSSASSADSSSTRSKLSRSDEKIMNEKMA